MSDVYTAGMGKTSGLEMLLFAEGKRRTYDMDAAFEAKKRAWIRKLDELEAENMKANVLLAFTEPGCDRKETSRVFCEKTGLPEAAGELLSSLHAYAPGEAFRCARRVVEAIPNVDLSNLTHEWEMQSVINTTNACLEKEALPDKDMVLIKDAAELLRTRKTSSSLEASLIETVKSNTNPVNHRRALLLMVVALRLMNDKNTSEANGARRASIAMEWLKVKGESATLATASVKNVDFLVAAMKRLESGKPPMFFWEKEPEGTTESGYGDPHEHERA